MTHKCVGKLTIIDSDNGLSPGRRQAIIWSNAGILSIRTLGRNFSEDLSEFHTFPFTKMYLKMSSVKWRTFCLGLNVSIHVGKWGPRASKESCTWYGRFRLSCDFVVVWYWSVLPISFRVTSLALWQYHVCSCTCKATAKDMGKYITRVNGTSIAVTS